MPSTHIPVPEKDYGSPLNHSRRSSDDLRRQISRLKSDLEAEKAKFKQFNRDKIAEVKRIQENADKEKQKALDSLVKRLQAEHAVELKRQREGVVREKETELRQVLKFKDEEVRTLKNQIQEEKEKTKRAEDELRRQLVDKSKGESADIEGKLRNEISVIKDEKHKLEELFKLKSAADSEKAEIIRRLQTEHKVERHKLIKEAKRASAKEMQQIRSTERALEEKSQELAFKDQLTRRLEAEKDELRRRRESSEWDSSRKSLKLDSLDEDFIEGREDCNYNRRDRERDLIKKNADLQTEVQHLEKKCAMLQKHQSSRHESPKVHANTEEKIKKLKKRNAELVAIARQLEEKAKRLQDEKISSTSSPDVEHVKRMFAKKRAKDLAEHAKMLLAKDSELDELRNQLGVGKIGGQVENDKIKELESIIRQSERERLLLEKQIQSPVQSRVTSPLHLDETVDSRQRLEALEDENEELKTTVKKLENIEDERLKLSWQLKEKTEECKRLMNDLEEKQAKCARLELEREKFVAKCTMLQKKNSEMTKKMKHLEELEREIADMKENLQKAEELHKTSDAECNKLKSQLENLLQVEMDLRASEEKRKHLEEEKMVTAKILAERDEEIQQLYKIQEEANRAHEMTVTTLDDEIRVLEQKCSETEDKYKSLHDKMETMKKQPSKRSVETAHKQTQTTSRPPSPTSRGAANLLESKQVNDSRGNAGADLSVLESHLTPGVAGKRAVNESQGETSGDEEIVIGRVGKPEQDSSDVNLDQVSDRLRQLVAMDTTSEEETLSGTEKTTKEDYTGQMVLGDGGEDELAALSRRISMAAMTESNSSSVSSSEDNKYDSDTSLNLTGNLGDLEDNQKDSSAPEDEQLELAETKRKSKNKRLNHYLPERPGKESTSGSEEGSLDEKYLSQDDSQISTEGGEEEKLAVFIARYSYDPCQHSPNDNPEAELAFQAGEYLYVFGEMDEDGFYIGELMSGQRGLVPSNFVERVADENDMPWLVTGEEDEDPSDNDEGERKDISPLDLLGESNGDQGQQVRMLKFSGRQHMNLRMSLDHFPDANLEDIEEEDEEEDCDMRSDDSAEDSQEAVISHDGLTSDDTDLEPFRVPSPKRLSLERQFSRSVLLCWKPPNDMSADDVKGYGVYVNGELKMRINGPNKTKALVEDIEPNETYRLSVRTITSKGEESVDREAMLTIGKDASLAPSQLQTTHLSPTSAKIEWLPGNSSFAHDIFLNDTYQRTIRPGTYQHTLMNLEPNQDYRVTVRARDPKLFLDHKGEMGREIRDPLASETEFRTEAGGLPEPPVNVQILGNQPTPRGLEVTWIPVTITEKGTSNGARVTGYKVYINAVPCTEVTSPLADSVAVAPWMVERSAKKSVDGLLRVTVRTQCVEGESVDSNKVEIPFDMLKFKASKLFKNKDGNKGFEEPCELVSFKQLESTEECFVNGGLEEEHPEEKTVNGNVEIDRVSLEGLRLQKDNNENIVQPVQPLESRTKGKGVLWRGGIQDDSDLSDSGCSTRVEKAWSSESEQENKDDEEDVELHNSLPSQQTQSDKHLDGMPPDISFESLEVNEEQFEDLEFCKLPNEGKRVQSQENVDSLNPSQDVEGKTRPSNSLSSTGADSSASEFDMEEFDASLKALQSSSRKKDPNKESAGDVVIRPLQSDESDMEEELSETPLSVIEEEEEENVESEIAVSIRSGSISEGFRSDDDVMDLLDDGPDSGEFVPASYKPTMITEFPKSDKDLADIEPLSNVERRTNSLSKYLPTASSSEDKELNNNPNEETPSKEDAEQNASFSDAEVDHDNLQKAHVTSTPVGSPRPQHGNTSEVDTSADYTESGREIEDIASIPTDNSTEAETDKADRTYTIEQHERTTAADGEKMKIFIALYDYDPRTMSPNADAEEEELAFREGDLIKIYGDKDDDGFYWGEAHGRQGFVPFNLVSEVQLEDGEELSLPTSPAVSSPPIPTQPVDSSPQQNTSHEQDGGTDETGYEDPRNSANFSLVPKRMVALFDYDPQQLSPNPDNEVELTFRVGDVIFVYGDMDPDGFYTGELRGVRGLVPSNFLEDLPDADDAVQISQTNQVSPQDKIITANGTSHIADETVKKKKGIFAKGKNLFKKITKEKKSKR